MSKLLSFVARLLGYVRPRTYTVKPGDTLWGIAQSYYGDGAKYPVIFDANRDLLHDPNKIYPGQVLRIPRP
jgi:nucleoid-associated protein YgaU